MRRLHLILLLLATTVSLLLAAPTAGAHQLQVVEPGSAELDAGNGELARLVHATLVDEGDELVVTVAGAGEAIEAVLLVPDQAPERGYEEADAPSLVLEAGDASRAGTVEARPVQVVDEATGIAYLELARIAVPASQPTRIIVRRGDVATRVAVRVGLPTSFVADDLESTPRVALDARLWAETPAPGTEPQDSGAPGSDDEPRTAYAWYGAGITVIALLVAAWWIRMGRAASRRRGIERARASARED